MALLVSALPLSAACTLAPTAPLRPVVFSWHCAPAADVGFFVAVVVCVAIVKWSQCAAPVCTCVSFCCLCGHCKVVTGCSSCLSDRQACVILGSLSIPSCSTEAAFVAPSLPGMLQALSATVPPACPWTFLLRCRLSCCGLTLRCSRWALAFSWSPFVPLSFLWVGLMDSPLSSLLHPFASLRFVGA